MFDHFVLSTEWIAPVFGRNNLHGLRQKQGSLIAHLKRACTIFARQPISLQMNSVAALRAGQNRN
jgi:hypothetical protein